MTPTHRVDLNADLGESYGLYKYGNDETLIEHLTTVNVACGYHAADPATMRSTVRLARHHGVAVGAHISYPDFAGFGRRRMELSEDEVRDITVHQIGALMGFCRAEGVEMQHVKPHGMLYLTAEVDRPTARGIVDGVKSVDADLILMLAGDIVATAPVSPWPTKGISISITPKPAPCICPRCASRAIRRRWSSAPSA